MSRSSGSEVAIRAFLGFFAEHPEFVELLIQERAQFKDRKKPTFIEHREANVRRWQELYRSLIAAGRLRDMPVERISDVISHQLYGTIFFNYVAGRTNVGGRANSRHHRRDVQRNSDGRRADARQAAAACWRANPPRRWHVSAETNSSPREQESQAGRISELGVRAILVRCVSFRGRHGLRQDEGPDGALFGGRGRDARSQAARSFVHVANPGRDHRLRRFHRPHRGPANDRYPRSRDRLSR